MLTRTSRHESRSPAKEERLTPVSFVFTSTRIGKSHRNIPDASGDTVATVLAQSSSKSLSASGRAPVLNAYQVATHAYGAAHALPVNSTFRRDKRDARPSPIRSIGRLPTPPRRPINPSSSEPKPQASKSFYLELIGRLAATTDGTTPGTAWSPISEPGPRKTNSSFPLTPTSNPSSPPAARNDNDAKPHESSYFNFKHRQPPDSHHR